jgi:uncharacterized membrane protein
VLGGFFALLCAVTFALTNAAVRRGVRNGSAVQATTLSIPCGVPVFFAALLMTGDVRVFADLPRLSVWVFALAGVNHFVVGRFANYRAIGAIGTNLAGPVTQFNLVVSLALAIVFLGETLTPLRMLGIVLIVASPAVASRGKALAAPAIARIAFTPKLAEGYLFAVLAALSYGLTPVLLRYAGAGRGLAGGLGGGVIGSAAALIAILALLLVPGHWRELRAVKPEAAKWFLLSGVMVYVSQIFYFMALTIAPVTVVAPIVALSNVLRIHFSRWLNPQHEVFGPQVMVATGLSFLGVVTLSVSADALPLPASWSAILGWHWP